MQAWQGLNEDCAGKINETMSKFKEKMTENITSQIQQGDASIVTLPSYNMPKYGAMDFSIIRKQDGSLYFCSQYI